MRGKLARPVRGGDTGKRTSPALAPRPVSYPTIPGDVDAAGIVAALAAGLAPGSFIAVSHLTADFAPEQVTSGVAAYNTLVPAGITARSHAGVTALFGGLSLVAPGVVPVAEWRPDAGCWPGQPADLYAGLATTARRSW